MTRRKRSAQRPATGEAPRSHQERDAQEIQDLPNREAMSVLTGLPIIPGLPIPDLLGDQTGVAAPGDTTPADPSATPGDTNAVAPTNEASIANVNSAGTTEATSSTQDAPIIQR